MYRVPVRAYVREEFSQLYCLYCPTVHAGRFSVGSYALVVNIEYALILLHLCR